MEQITYIIIGGTLTITGTIIGYLSNHLLENKRIREERQVQLNKEIYFKLEDKAESVLEGLYILKRRSDEMFLAYKGFTIKKIRDLPEFKDNFLEKRLKLPLGLQLFFRDANKEKYNNLVNKLSQMGGLYFKLFTNRDLDDGDRKTFDRLYYELESMTTDLSEEIVKILQKEKDKILDIKNN